MNNDAVQPERGGVSPELDAMSCDLIGACLDELAQGELVEVVVFVEDSSRHRAVVSFDDDGEEACLEAAHAYVREAAAKGVSARDVVDGADAGAPAEDGKTGRAVRYAVAGMGFVEDEDGVPVDALLVSFGEKGAPSGYSAFVLVDGVGMGDDFMWSDPEPAGEEPLLV